MELVFEVFGILWEVFRAFGKMIIELLPTVIELKQLADMFSWQELLAAYIGIPSIIVTGIVFLIKGAKKYGRN